MEVWTLNWRPDPDLDSTTPFGERTGVWAAQALNVRLGREILGFPPDGVRRSVGRAAGCTLCVPDAERRVSSTHLLLEFMEGRWFAADVSRNGTWLKEQDNILRLPPGKQFLLPRAGRCAWGGRSVRTRTAASSWSSASAAPRRRHPANCRAFAKNRVQGAGFARI